MDKILEESKSLYKTIDEHLHTSLSDYDKLRGLFSELHNFIKGNK